MAKRIITTDITEEDQKNEGSLRPKLLSDYVGQEKAKKTLSRKPVSKECPKITDSDYIS